MCVQLSVDLKVLPYWCCSAEDNTGSLLVQVAYLGIVLSGQCCSTCLQKAMLSLDTTKAIHSFLTAETGALDGRLKVECTQSRAYSCCEWQAIVQSR